MSFIVILGYITQFWNQRRTPKAYRVLIGGIMFFSHVVVRSKQDKMARKPDNIYIYK